MPRPTITSWLMETTLIPNFHYILLKDDFSDLHSKNQPYAAVRGEAGGHAVTAVGYDDSKYGGAFRILNSYIQIKLFILRK